MTGLFMSLDLNGMQDVVSIEFSRAFDSVVHSKLLYKLRNIGITGDLYNWIAEFLQTVSNILLLKTSFPISLKLSVELYKDHV